MRTNIQPLLNALSKRGKQFATFFRNESPLQYIVTTFKRELSYAEKMLLWLVLIGVVLFPLVTTLVNQWGPQYEVPNTLGFDGLLAGAALLMFGALKYRQYHRRTGPLIITLLLISFSFLASVSGATSVMATPFFSHEISHELLAFDNLIGFNQTAWMAWTAHHPSIHHWLEVAYDSLFLQTLLIPLGLTLFGLHKNTKKLLIILLLGSFVAYVIYYFIPADAPAYVIKNPYFTHTAYQLVERTSAIRQHIPYDLSPGAGLIAFPSFHAFAGLACLVAPIAALSEARKKITKIILIIASVVLAILNVSLILATLALGFHYVTDIVASGILFVGIYLLAKKWVNK